MSKLEKSILFYLVNKTYERGLNHSQKKEIRALSQKYCVVNEYLFKKKKNDEGDVILRACVFEERDKVVLLNKFHNKGGNNKDSLFAMIKQKYSWKGLSLDCSRFLKSCSCSICSLKKGGNKTVVPLKFFDIDSISSGAFWHMDLGKVNVPCSFSYFFVIIDRITKSTFFRLQCKKDRDDTKESILSFFDYHDRQFGNSVIETIVSDNGGEFLNFDLKILFEELLIERRQTRPYHPQANGMAESVVKRAKKAIVFVFSNNKVLDRGSENLVMDYLDGSHHSTIEMSPKESRQKTDPTFWMSSGENEEVAKVSSLKFLALLKFKIQKKEMKWQISHLKGKYMSSILLGGVYRIEFKKRIRNKVMKQYVTGVLCQFLSAQSFVFIR